MHLRDTHAVGDLGLRQVALEAKPEDQPLARRQRVQRPAQRLAQLDELVARVLVPERAALGPLLVLVAGAPRRVQEVAS